MYDLFLRQYGIEKARISALAQGGDNETLIVESDNGLKVLRIYRTTPPDEVDFELNVIDFLLAGDFPTPCFLRTTDGNVKAQVNGVVAVLFEFVEGKPIRKDNQAALNVAKTMARLHHLTISIPFMGVRSRSDIGRIRNFVRFVENSPALAEKNGCSEYVAELNDLLGEIYPVLNNRSIPSGIVHHDLHADNVFADHTNTIVSIIDFDESYYGPLVFDLASLIHYWTDRSDSQFCYDSIRSVLDAYQSIRTIVDLERRFLPEALAAFYAADAAEYLIRYFRKDTEGLNFNSCNSLRTFYSLRRKEQSAILKLFG